jgi:hypothetical protein
MPKYHWVCSTCGSKNVNCSGNLHWDYDKQDWVFDGVPLDDDFCEDCGEECRIEQLFDKE